MKTEVPLWKRMQATIHRMFACNEKCEQGDAALRELVESGMAHMVLSELKAQQGDLPPERQRNYFVRYYATKAALQITAVGDTSPKIASMLVRHLRDSFPGPKEDESGEARTSLLLDIKADLLELLKDSSFADFFFQELEKLPGGGSKWLTRPTKNYG